MSIQLLLDSLYAAGPATKMIEDFGWKYIIVFKEGSMPDTYKEFNLLKKLCHENTALIKDENITQHFSWVNNIKYKDFIFDALELNEYKSGQHSKFVWVSNLKANKGNVSEIAKRGRLRWKIENEGFNIQKNGGYNLEHPYSSNEMAMKNFYLILQITHIISQLMEEWNLLKNQIEKVFGSITNVFHQPLEDLRTKFIGLEFLNFKPIQIKDYHLLLKT